MFCEEYRMLINFQDVLAYNQLIHVEKIAFCNYSYECNDVSFRFSDSGKCQRSPERMMKAECFQSDNFHLRVRNGRRRSGIFMSAIYLAHHTEK